MLCRFADVQKLTDNQQVVGRAIALRFTPFTKMIDVSRLPRSIYSLRESAGRSSKDGLYTLD